MTIAQILALIPHDKALHALAGVVVAFLGLLIGHLVGISALPLAAAAVTLAAVGREVYNQRTSSAFDARDFSFTMAGGLLIVAAAALGG